MKTATTVHDVIDAVCQHLDNMAEHRDMTPEQARDAARDGVFGDRGRAAYEVWYAWQYDGIDGGAAERWLAASTRTAEAANECESGEEE